MSFYGNENLIIVFFFYNFQLSLNATSPNNNALERI